MNEKLNTDCKRKIISWLLTLLGLAIAVAMIYPFLFMLSSSFKPSGMVFSYPVKLIPDKEIFTFDNYKKVLSPRFEFGLWYYNTIYVEVMLNVLKTFIVTITGYAFARLRFKGRDILFVLFLAVLMIPGEVTLVQRYILYKFLHLTDTLWVLIIPPIFDVYFVFLIRQAFMGIPYELTEAGIIDGCGHFQVFYKIILPQIKIAVMTMILFSFVWCWNDYANPFIFNISSSKTVLSVGIQTFQQTAGADYAVQMAGVTMTMLPVFILFFFTQKFFIKGLVTSGLKG